MSKVLVKQTLLYSVGELVPKIIAFILLPVYMVYLTADEYGILSYTSAVVMFIYVLGTFCLNSFVLRKYPELNNQSEKKKLIGNVFLLIAILNILLLIVGYFVIPILIKTYDIQIPWDPYFKYALFTNFLEGFSIIPLIVYRIKLKANVFVLLSLSKTLLQLGLTYYFIVILRQGLIGNYLGQLYPLFFFFFIYVFVILKEGTLNLNFSQIKEGIQFSWPLLPGSIAFLALGLIDRVILERYVPISQLGVYNVAYLISLSVNIVISSGYKALEPQIFIKYNQSNFLDFIKNAQAVFLFVVYCTAMGVAIFSQEVFKLMTSNEFYQGYLLVPVIMIGVIMTGQNVIFG
jgi:O-antigen/teichoic acid export membrane protein